MSSNIPFPLRESQQAESSPKKNAPNLNVKLVCPDCKKNPPHIIEEFASGDLVCGDCGLVLGDRIIDTRSEWRTFANDEGDDPSRVGAAANPLLDGSQLDTIISKRDGHTGNSKDLNKVHSLTTAAKGEKNLTQVYKGISAMCDSHSFSKQVSDTAKQLYKRVEDEKLLRGKSTEAIVAACIFLACRAEKAGRTFREICQLTRVPKKEIGRCYKQLQKVLLTDGRTPAPEDLISRFCSKLLLPNSVQKSAVYLVQQVKELGTLAGKSPISIAAVCIYMVTLLHRQNKTTRDISLVAGISEATIKAAYKELYKQREQLIDLSVLQANSGGESFSFDDLIFP